MIVMLNFDRTTVDITINGTTTTHKRNFLRKQLFESAIFYAKEMCDIQQRKGNNIKP